MSLSPTTPEIKIKQLTFLEIQETNLIKYTNNSNLPLSYTPYLESNTHHSFLKNLHANNVISFNNPSNGVFDSLSYLLLKTIYSNNLDQQLLKIVKFNLYQDDTNLQIIENHPLENLKCEEMKKFIVEFFFQLCFSDFNMQLQKRLKKNPVILIIMSLFLRYLLVKLGLSEAKNYQQKLPFETVIQIIGDYLDLNFRKKQNCYLFIDSSMFLYQNEESILAGKYSDQPKNYQPHNSGSYGSGNHLNSDSTAIKSPDRRSSWHLDRKDSNYSSNDSHISIEAPTPCFNSEEINCQNNSLKKQNFGIFPIRNAAMLNSNFDQHYFTQIAQIKKRTKYYPPNSPSLQEKLLSLQTPNENNKRYFIENTQTVGSFQILSLDKEHEFMILSNISEQKIIIDKSNNISYTQFQCNCKIETKVSLKLYSNIISITIKVQQEQQQQQGKPHNFNFLSRYFKKQSQNNHIVTSRKKYPKYNEFDQNILNMAIRTQQSEEVESPNSSTQSQLEFTHFGPIKFDQSISHLFLQENNKKKQSRPSTMFTNGNRGIYSFKSQTPKVNFIYKRR